jgi:hypothetical protein
MDDSASELSRKPGKVRRATRREKERATHSNNKTDYILPRSSGLQWVKISERAPFVPEKEKPGRVASSRLFATAHPPNDLESKGSRRSLAANQQPLARARQHHFYSLGPLGS